MPLTPRKSDSTPIVTVVRPAPVRTVVPSFTFTVATSRPKVTWPVTKPKRSTVAWPVTASETAPVKSSPTSGERRVPVQRSGGGRAVHLHVQVVDRQRQAVDADERGVAEARVDREPGAAVGDGRLQLAIATVPEATWIPIAAGLADEQVGHGQADLRQRRAGEARRAVVHVDRRGLEAEADGAADEAEQVDRHRARRAEELGRVGDLLGDRAGRRRRRDRDRRRQGVLPVERRREHAVVGAGRPVDLDRQAVDVEDEVGREAGEGGAADRGGDGEPAAGVAPRRWPSARRGRACRCRRGCRRRPPR